MSFDEFYSVALAERNAAWAEVRRLEAEIKQLRGDAKRYRWLRTKSRETLNDECDNIGAAECVWVCTEEGLAKRFYDEELDAAIDSARGAP
jgi:hypothetical protein